MYYFAYGSNLNERHMKWRCPRAVKVKSFVLADAALVFRGVADVTIRNGSVVPGGIWKITEQCEELLDRYEGVSSNLYLKRYLPIKFAGKIEDVLFYQMSTHRGIQPPGQDYLNTISQGYRDFGLDLNVLEVAVQESWSNKELTDQLRRRYENRGRPPLARGVS